MVDIVIVRSSSVIRDPRVKKIFRSLKKKYSVSILGWNREKNESSSADFGKDMLSLFNMKAPTGKTSLVLYMPVFWSWIFFKLSILRPKIVHACDFDTLPPAYMYKTIFRKKLVFDVFDRYAMTFLPQNNGLLSIAINKLEEFFARRSNVLITVSPKILETFREKPDHCEIIMNCSEDIQLEKTEPNNQFFTLVYTGNIQRKRGLERIIEAIKELEGVKLFVAGRIIEKDFFQQIMCLPYVEYKGFLLPSEALELEGNSDVLISLYDLTVLNYKLTIPNKTFEAMMFGIPLITNVASDIIDEVNCGIQVDYNDLDKIRSAIINLRDNYTLRKKLGENGRKAFEKKFNWNIMEEELHKMYDGMLNT